MGILDSLLGRRNHALGVTIDGRPLTDPSLAEWTGAGRHSAAGATVTADKALSLSGVFAAVNLLSNIVGCLPLHVYRRSGRQKSVAETQPAYRVLHTRANPEMTAAIARRTMEWHRLLWGAGCAEIGWDGAGQCRAIWPLEGWRVQPDRDEAGRLFYRVDGTRRVALADMLYVPLVSEDGVCGRSFLDYAVESLGLSISAQEFAARFFGNGAKPGGLLIHPGHRTKEQRDELRRSWQGEHGGSPNAHRVGVLWGGWSFDRTAGAVAPEEAQLLETRKFSTEEVARWLNIPPHLLAELSRATFSNIEEQGQSFVTYCVGLIVELYEQEYNSKLLDPPRLYCKHSLAALLRGNSAARSAYYRELWNIGVLSQNDILDLEDMNPIEGGDEHWVPVNMAPLSRALEPPELPPGPEPIPNPELIL